MPASRTLLPTASSAHCTAAKKIFLLTLEKRADGIIFISGQARLAFNLSF
ncbi:Hypothetical protein ABZS17H1_03269 [Kosakonia cowanii]